ncbi:proline racemase [Haloferax elongans ATCC BAA-1513]|uniref:Proline racemase n=1 Tax=Haloferax elongans ATCC BAA-1513 TaxID=1230453 RepID=M0HND9_HALEO|nr:proline racemase family protein [Haloferax elongans]ELZ84619.1 proline racemase [Haloferax elongans ATCC BAA-1513]
MNSEISIETVDTHTGGEPTRIVVGGLDESTFAGDSVREQRDAFAETHDWIRRLLMKEPRGHDNMFGAVLVEPRRDDADVGVFFMDSEGYLDMCGHGTIGVVSALVELGRLPALDSVQVETPAGLVEAAPKYSEGGVETAYSEGGVEGVTIQNVQSFVYDETTVSVSAADSPIHVDIVYSGNFFALVDSEQLGLPVTTEYTSDFVERGLEIRAAVNDKLDITNPLTGESGAVSISEIYETNPDVDRSVVVFGDGQVDRSPCGTGTCAKMTLLHHEGLLEVGEPYPHESIVGTRFEGRLVDVKERDGVTLTTPTITGTARITGKHTFVKDPKDSITGFSV